MSFIEIDPEHFGNEPVAGLDEAVCMDALRAAMPFMAEETYIGDQLEVAYNAFEETGEIPDDETFENALDHAPRILETTTLRITNDISASFSTTPKLRIGDVFSPMIMRGFLALHLDNNSDGMCEVDQVIFRLPWHLEGAAVFRGFSIEESARITDEAELTLLQQKLAQLSRLFVSVMKSDPTVRQESLIGSYPTGELADLLDPSIDSEY